MKLIERLIAGAALLAITGVAQAVVINLEDATNGGGFFGTVTITNDGTDTVQVVADIRDPINPGLTQGDILGLWFDLANVAAHADAAAAVLRRCEWWW